MHITHFGCTNLPPLGRMRLDFDDRVNLFVGPNASRAKAACSVQ